MWLYAFYISVFLQCTNAILEKRYNAHEEAIFADVIRNISRVNNVLQELISNYEQLQKIYKSQENTEDDYSSDTEIDEVFKSIQKASNDRKNKSKFNPTDRPVKGDSFPATQMIWSEDDDNDFIDEKSKEKDQAEAAERLSEIESLKKVQANPTNDNINENSSSGSIETNKNTSTVKPKDAKIIFIDTHKELEAFNENKNVLPINVKKLEQIKKRKTRYKKVSKTNKTNTSKFHKAKVRDTPVNTLWPDNETKSIKKIIYEETFSPKNIWNEIIKNKPIQLEPQKETTYNTPQKRAANKHKLSLNSATKKTARVIVTKNAKEAEEKDTYESTEDETIAKDIFKTNVLRHAYGDACMKVVIKKCYKACKQAGKSFCTLYKCKRTFRSKFKELSKTGCIQEFSGPGGNKSNVQYRGQDDVFTDATRGRFLDAACLPHVELGHKPTIFRNDTPTLKTRPIAKYDKGVNILRDKYERACKKASAKKCTSACNYAYTDTCNAFKCDRTKRKKFKKYCKKQCQVTYKVFSGSDSSDSDSTSLSSDTSTS